MSEDDEERNWSEEGGDLEEDEEGENPRRRGRDESLQLLSNELRFFRLYVDVPWPVYRYRGTAWFTEDYQVSGIPRADTQKIGWRLLREYARSNDHHFLVRLKDARNNVLYGCYQNHEAYVRNFVAPLGEDPVQSGVERVSVECSVKCQERDTQEAGSLVLDTISHFLELDWHSKRLVAVKRSASKRIRLDGGGGAALDEWEPPVMEPLLVTDDGFQFGNEEAFELTPLNAPCKLTVTLHRVSVEEARLLKHDMSLLLRTCFEKASDLMDSGFEQTEYDDTLLRYRHDSDTNALFFIYDDPSLYFPNAEALACFWDFASKVMMAHHPHRDTELVTLRNERDTFTRKFGVDFTQFQAPYVQCLVNRLGVPIAERPETHISPSPFSISCVDSVLGDAICSEKLVHQLTVSHNFTIKELVEVAKRHPGLEKLDHTAFSRAPVRNRLMINPYAMGCLYMDPRYQHNYHRPYRDHHQTWVKVDLDNSIMYECSCRHPLPGQPRDVDDVCEVIKLGNLRRDLDPPEPLTMESPLPYPRDVGLPYGLDRVVHFKVQGVAEFLAHALRRRLVYCGGIWYVWTGELWVGDKGPDFSWITAYISRSVAMLLDDYLSGIDEDNKQLRKSVEQLRSSFCMSLKSAHMVLKILVNDLSDASFEEARRHRGYIASRYGIVDLRSGICRPYRYDDYVTERSDMSYFPCGCEPGTCFNEGVTCDCIIAEDMKWIDLRIREITGHDFKHVVWRTDNNELGRAPTTAGMDRAKEFWRDRANGKEFFRVPSVLEAQDPVHYTSHLELAFEDGGLRNYHRFRWTLGYMEAGFADLKLFVFGYGEQNNGKTLVWENLMEVLEQYFTPMASANVFSKGGSRADDGPTPGIMHVRDKRAGLVAEMSQFDILNDASMKRWAGRDRQVGRYMRSEMTSFKPDLVAMVNGNVKPKMNILDEPSWDRFHLLYYPINYLRAENRPSYPGPGWKLNERPRNPDFIKMFASPRYQQALYNWAIRAGFYFMTVEKCPLPALVQQKIIEMKNRNNPIPDFINDLDNSYAFDPNGEVPFKQFFSALKDWCKRESKDTKFTTPAAFRKLILDLGDTDSAHKIELVGQINTADEAIRGIIDNNAPPIPMQIGYNN